LSEGTDLVAVSRALGHHSAAFTLSRYAHLLPGELAPPLDLAGVSSGCGGEDRKEPFLVRLQTA
jgi:hypothetical protein